MAKLNLEYYEDEDLYSDGDIEDTILHMVEMGQGLDDIKPSETEFPVLYHLSHERANIINWYPFKEHASVLEIGAGPGAITGTLCELAERVTSVELSKRRATINYLRNKEKDNLEIMVGNYNKMDFRESFDYIVLNGVFEYAMSFTEGPKPYETFIKKISKVLKADGVLLIAIENRLGLKYFAGAPEDHTDNYFLGLNRYENNNSVRTFSKTEMDAILNSCGFRYANYYYPYPDYKFPTEIFTKDSMKEFGYGRDYYVFTDRFLLFNESKVAKSLVNEGVADTFANSFFIESSRTALDSSKRVIYAKAGADRAKDYRILTIVVEEDGNRVVYKKNLTKESKAHIERLANNEQTDTSGNYSNVCGELTNAGLKYEFLQDITLENEIVDFMNAGDEDSIKKAITDAFYALFSGKKLVSGYNTQEFKEVFGDTEPSKIEDYCISPANIDLLSGNIFLTNVGYRVIDCEWIFDFDIPVSFIVWRFIEDLYSKHYDMQSLIDKAALMKEYGLTEELNKVYKEWNNHFVKEYVKADAYEAYSVPKMYVSLEEIKEQKKGKDNHIVSSLYIDYGNGYSEENKVTVKHVPSNEEYDIVFNIPDCDKVKAVRFDPIEGEYIYCEAKTKTGLLWKSLEPANADWKELDGYVFLNKDPIFFVNANKLGETLHIKGRIKVLGEKDLVEYCKRR